MTYEFIVGFLIGAFVVYMIVDIMVMCFVRKQAKELIKE